MPLEGTHHYLGLIFGQSVAGISLGAGAYNPLLSNMFEVFNTLVLSVGFSIFAYISFISTINTANEGKFLGKKLSAPWTPIKLFLGMALMAPIPGSGYSLIQALVLAFLLQGVSSANMLWHGVLNNLSAGLSATKSIQEDYSLLAQNAKSVAQAALNVLITQKALHAFNKAGTESEFIRLHRNQIQLHAFRSPPALKTDDNTKHASVLGHRYIGIPRHSNSDYRQALGKFSIHVLGNPKNTPTFLGEGNFEQNAYKRYQTLQDALSVLMQDLDSLAETIVSNKIEINRTNPGRLENSLATKLGVAQYHMAIQAYLHTLGELANPVQTDKITQLKIERAKEKGWSHAGSLYFAFSEQHTKGYSEDLQSTPTPIGIPMPNETGTHFKNNVFLQTHFTNAQSQQLNAYLKIAERLTHTQNHYSANLPSQFGMAELSETLSLEGTFSHGIDSIQKVFKSFLNQAKPESLNSQFNEANDLFLQMATLSEKPDPIVNFRKLGNDLMATTEKVCAETVKAGFKLLYKKRNQASMQQRSKEMMLLVAGFVFVTLLSLLWAVGATFGIYIPMVPFLLFLFATLGWLTLVVEAMVAAPIIALGLITPSQDDFLGRAMAGIKILMNLFLRPSLMVIGFLFAAKLTEVGVNMVNFGMKGVMQLYTGSGLILFPALVAKMALYLGFMVVLIHKCFSLIHLLPEKVLRWLSDKAESGLGEERLLQEVKQRYDTSEQTVHSVVKGTTSSAMMTFKTEQMHQAKQLPAQARQRTQEEQTA